MIGGCVTIGCKTESQGLNVLLNFAILINLKLGMQIAKKCSPQFLFLSRGNETSGRVTHVWQEYFIILCSKMLIRYN